MPPRQRRFFLCNGKCVDYDKLHEHPTSHIIGEVVYVTFQKRRITVMVYWDEHVSAATVPPLHPKKRMTIIGNVMDVVCLHPGCTRVTSWEIGRAAFEQLMERYAPKEVTPQTVV